MTCPFCTIANDPNDPVVAYRDARLAVFADRHPIRTGHVQIVTRAHYETFDAVPPDLAAELLWLGQRIARLQKRMFGVKRVGFVFTGNDVPHVHAHVLPLFARDDITSARYGHEAHYISQKEQAQTAAVLRQALEAER